jgi:methionyl-tRNA formyltransferase
LPNYRGASPIQAAILAGEAETGVSLMVMDAEIDHGPVIAVTRRPIAPDDTYETLEKKLGEAGADLLIKEIDDFAAGKTKARAQDHDKATFTKTLDRAHGFICWDHETAAEIERKSRAYFPWPGCFAVWKRGGKRTQLKIIKVRTAGAGGDEMPGTVSAENGKMFVRTKEGRLELIEVQAEGKKAMTADVFLNGYRDIVGAVLESTNAPLAP